MRSLDIVTWNGEHLDFTLEHYDRQQGAGNQSYRGIHNNGATHLLINHNVGVVLGIVRNPS